MPSSFFGLNVARSGMSTYNAWLNTTGHNVANVKTEGYTRQTVDQRAGLAVSLGTSYGMMGTGSEAVNILSQRDQYYDNKYRLSNSDYGKYNTANYYMQDIGTYLYAATPESGAMTNSLDSFFTMIKDLTTDVSNETKRTQAVGYANMLSSYIKEAAGQLKTMQEEVNGQIAHTVDQINAYAQEISSLTRQINTLEVYGTRANDLRDQRAQLVDELSELANVDVLEKEPTGGKGYTQFIVTLDNAVLVDTYEYNSLIYSARNTYNSIGDIDNLYDLKWSTGQRFGIHDEALGGRLQALFELRDGNNGEVFEGTVKTAASKGDNTLVVSDVNELGQSILKLDIPATDGVLTVNGIEYSYEYFDCSVDSDGKYTYTFHLNETLIADVPEDAKMHVSDEVDFRGIPYYQSQLNEFIRTFSYYFNEIQTSGLDLNGNEGTQMFIGTDKVSGRELNYYNTMQNFAFNSKTGKVSGGTSVVTGEMDTNSRGYEVTTYYKMTALTTKIDSNILKDGKLLALAGKVYDESGNVVVDANGQPVFNGVSNGDNAEKMSRMQEVRTMFRQGKPESFLQILSSTAGVDGQKSIANESNAENIKNAVNSRRLSKSGVDEDEEGQNLIICQNLLNIQYKVLSVMNEVLDKLINGTAI